MTHLPDDGQRRPTYQSMQAYGNIRGLLDVLKTTESLFSWRLNLPKPILEAYMEALKTEILEGRVAESYYYDQLNVILEAEGEDAYREARKIVEEYKPCK